VLDALIVIMAGHDNRQQRIDERGRIPAWRALLSSEHRALVACPEVEGADAVRHAEVTEMLGEPPRFWQVQPGQRRVAVPPVRAWQYLNRGDIRDHG